MMFTFVLYSLLLCYVFRMKTPKLFGVIAISLQRAIEHRFVCELRHLAQLHAIDSKVKSILSFLSLL